MQGQNAKRWRPRQETRLTKRKRSGQFRNRLGQRSPYNRPVPNGVPETETHPTQLLRRSLANGRLGHAYLFVGGDIESLESHAVELARTLNCQSPKATGETGIRSSRAANAPPVARSTATIFPTSTSSGRSPSRGWSPSTKFVD